MEFRDAVLAAIRRRGHKTDDHNSGGRIWFTFCPVEDHSLVRISNGESVDLACLQYAPSTPCSREQMIRAYGLGNLFPEEVAYVDKLRDSIVDTVGLDNIAPPTPLVHNVLQQDSIAWLQGRPGHGKSFLAIDIAASVATGWHWQSRNVALGHVLYVAAEGVSGIRRRVRAWENLKRTEMKGVHFLPMAVQAASDQEWSALLTIAQELKPKLIVLDTQARVTVGMEENSARDMGVFVQRLEELRQATRACVLVVHHEGHSGSHMRGSTAMVGAATTILRVEKKGDYLTVTCVKQKDQEEFGEMILQLLPCLESAVICPADRVGNSQTLTPQEHRLLSTFREDFGNLWVTISKVLEVAEIPSTTGYRSIKVLVEHGLVEQGGTDKRPVYRLREVLE